MKSRYYFLLILLFLLVFSSRADIHVTSFKSLNSDRTAIDYPVLDKNGRHCAVIKIKTDNKQFLLDATQKRERKGATPEQTFYYMELQNDNHPDEIWFYVSQETKRFRLMHPQYGLMAEEGYNEMGYYIPQMSLVAGSTYRMGIMLTMPMSPVYSAIIYTYEPKTFGEVTIDSDDRTTKLEINGQKILPNITYKVQEGEFNFTAKKNMHQSVKERYELKTGEHLHIHPSLSALPMYMFGGLEVGKPSIYDNLAYGARVGFVCRWGLYASFITTFGGSANGANVDLSNLYIEPVSPYSDAFCQYTNWNVGFIYRCFSPLHLFAGLGTANRSVTWNGKDGKRHESADDTVSGISWETGILYNLNKLYLSASADCLNGGFGAKLGIGMYLNFPKK